MKNKRLYIGKPNAVVMAVEGGLSNAGTKAENMIVNHAARDNVISHHPGITSEVEVSNETVKTDTVVIAVTVDIRPVYKTNADLSVSSNEGTVVVKVTIIVD